MTEAVEGVRPIDPTVVKDDTVYSAVPSGKSDNPTPYRPLAFTPPEELLHMRSTGGDPVAGHAKASGINLSGQADPLYAKKGLVIGDRVYHKNRKKEGEVTDMAASGKIKVAFDDGSEGWQNPDNIVKLT